ncbi:PEP-CTERM sorting domain-containing protein [Nitrosomonas oligotropha]|uniref:PEP-CTERM protein-sorting domain-containing protein n=1 Tax=Nitrosomonas oligotropha TaxID=42354 RepID=A0A1H8R8J7_9PROT|nr:PEP-CTERM sorting domain-containing protein [Nitrosomonas oligotropha]SDW84202.1 PEP-CTERM protein-sorting domain-containing protein [Nitrosomonas oligotropha]SEO62681.1 PEP-CTERM protein-sorting domain-containing protein [Nitrosomonas oligotropha]
MSKTLPVTVFAFSLVLTGLLSQVVQAEVKTWSNSDSFWNIDSNWSPVGVPSLPDDVMVSPYGGVDTVLRFDSFTGAQFANSLVVNSDAANTIDFLQTGGNLAISHNEIVGLGSFGSTGKGSYTLNGGTNAAESLILGGGFGSNGSFNQNGGMNRVSGLAIGSGAVATGKYILNSGSLWADSEYFGTTTSRYDPYGPGNGIFIQNGGIHTVNGELGMSAGTYTLGAGSLLTHSEVLGSGGSESGYGDFTQSGGMHTVITDLVVGGNSGIFDTATGHYRLSAGSLLAGSEHIGEGVYNSSGSIIQSGGSNTVSGILSIGNGIAIFAESSRGRYSLSAGSLSVGSEDIGYGGTFIQNGGTHSVKQELTIGKLIGSGTYNLNAGSLSTGSEFIASGNCCVIPAGSFNQTGGTHTVSGLVTNHGAYNLSGGAFVAGAIDNSGTITQTGGTMTVNGNVINAASGKIEIANSPAIFTGDVVNNGQFKTTHTTVTFSGTYTENGSYISDPSINNFTNLIIGTSGYLVGGTGDEWHITGSFENHSLQNTLWNTANAGLFFDGGGLKSLYLAGIDEGASPFGFTNNFAFGSLFLAQGAELNILDGNATPGAAMYVEQLNLAGGVSQLSSIHSDYNIYYNPALAGNAYLLGKTYALDGGGLLMAAVPEPETYAMLLAGLSVLGFAIRRREQNRKRLNRFD